MFSSSDPICGRYLASQRDSNSAALHVKAGGGVGRNDGGGDGFGDGVGFGFGDGGGVGCRDGGGSEYGDGGRRGGTGVGFEE